MRLYAIVIGDGYLAGASDSWWSGGSVNDWRHSVSAEHLEDAEIVTLDDVPLQLAEELMAMGTSEQWFSDGYEAMQAAVPFVESWDS